MSSLASSSQGLIKILLVMVAVLIGINVALVTGILAITGGDELSSAIMSGGVGFASSVALVLLIEKSLGLLSDSTSEKSP